MMTKQLLIIAIIVAAWPTHSLSTQSTGNTLLISSSPLRENDHTVTVTKEDAAEKPAWQAGTVVNNTLTDGANLSHTIANHIDGSYSPSALIVLQPPKNSQIQISNPHVTATMAYNIPDIITFQGNVTTLLKFSNGQEYPIDVTIFIDNLTTRTDFNNVADLWVSTTVPEFMYKVKYSGGTTLAIDQDKLVEFLNTFLQETTKLWLQLISDFKVDITQKKRTIAGNSSPTQVGLTLLVEQLQAVEAQLLPF